MKIKLIYFINITNEHIIICTLEPAGTVTTAPNSNK